MSMKSCGEIKILLAFVGTTQDILALLKANIFCTTQNHKLFKKIQPSSQNEPLTVNLYELT
jgi:hypothetical protein